MSDRKNTFDIRPILESIGDTIRSAGDSMSASMRPAEVWTESGLRTAVLRALVSGPKTGHDIIGNIHAANSWGIKPAASKVYPLLESLLDELLVSVAVVKDRKVYTLTKTGKAAEKLLVDEAAAPSEGTTGSGWDMTQWADPNGNLTTASRRLARTAFDVARHGTKEQQEAAAVAIDDARRKLNEILAAK
jgi:DNA-binding PadR family transcriptional regulator